MDSWAKGEVIVHRYVERNAKAFAESWKEGIVSCVVPNQVLYVNVGDAELGESLIYRDFLRNVELQIRSVETRGFPEIANLTTGRIGFAWLKCEYLDPLLGKPFRHVAGVFLRAAAPGVKNIEEC
jgi:hypothetical protein